MDWEKILTIVLPAMFSGGLIGAYFQFLNNRLKIKSDAKSTKTSDEISLSEATYEVMNKIVKDLQHEVTRMHEQISKTQEALVSLRRENQTLMEENKKLISANEQLRSEKRQLHNEVQRLNERINKLEDLYKKKGA